MPRPKPIAPVNSDFVKPIIVAGVFLIIYALINGVFTLANTKIQYTSISTDSNSKLETPSASVGLVSAELTELRAKVRVDAHEAWQNTNIFVEKGSTVQIKVLDGKWTEWKGMREYNRGAGSNYICAVTMKAETCVEPVPDFPSGALIGRIDRQILKIGSSGKFTAAQSGVLQLRMNDGDAGIHDNDGLLTVEVVLITR